MADGPGIPKDLQKYLADPEYHGAFNGAQPFLSEEECLEALRDSQKTRDGGWKGLQDYLKEKEK